MPVAVITGTNRGLGLELTKRLKDEYTIYAVCRKSSKELEELGVHIIDGVDLSKEADFEKISKHLDGIKIDLIFNNAGIYPRDTLESVSFEKFESAFATNTIAPIILVKTLMNQLNKGCKIIMMSSRMGSISDITSGRSYAYRASKAALNSIGKCLSVELKDRDVYTLLIHPGSVNTGMTKEWLIDVETSVTGILKRIHQLNAEHSGRFYAFDDRELSW